MANSDTGERETKIDAAGVDPQSGDDLLTLIIDLGARVTSLEKLFEGGLEKRLLQAGPWEEIRTAGLADLMVNIAKRAARRRRNDGQDEGR